MKIKSLLNAFHILFYPGSQVSKNNYIPLTSSLNYNTSFIKGTFLKNYSPLKNIDSNDTILIGHSFGGYFALLDYQRYPNKVKGIVLLNSHFNSRNKAFYPGIKQEEIKVPVLTILSDKDERLPIQIAVDDLLEKNKLSLNDKYYIINKNFTHFSGFEKKINDQTFLIKNQINNFIECLQSNNFTNIENISDCKKYVYNIYNIIPNSIVLSNSINLFDALLSVNINKELWDYYHWILFLISKPNNLINIVFETQSNVFLKTRNIDLNYIKLFINSLSLDKKIQLNIIKLPILHPSILLWLYLPLNIKKKDDCINIDVIELKINNETTYYKIPNPNKIFIKNF